MLEILVAEEVEAIHWKVALCSNRSLPPKTLPTTPRLPRLVGESQFVDDKIRGLDIGAMIKSRTRTSHRRTGTGSGAVLMMFAMGEQGQAVGVPEDR